MIRKRFLEDKAILAVSVLIVTMTIANLAQAVSLGGLFSTTLSSTVGVILFIATTGVAYIMMRYLLSSFFKSATSGIGKKSMFTKLLQKSVNWIYYMILALLVITSYQMLLFSLYNTSFLVAVTLISSSSVVLALSLLTIKLFSWYKSAPNSLVFLYALTTLLSVVGTITGIIVIQIGHNIVERDPTIIEPISSATASSKGSPLSAVIDTSKESRIFQIVAIPGRIGFVLYWIANVLLLRNYADKIGRKKFWVIVSLPLTITLIGIFLVTLAASTSGTALFGVVNLTIIRISISLSALMGGVLNGVIFLLVARSMNESGHTYVQNYLRSAAFGLMLMAISTTLPQTSLLYPPFALVSWSLSGIAAYFIAFGFYSTVVSLTQDINLRKSVKKLVISDSKLFDSVSTAQIQLDLEKRVTRIVREQEEEMEKHTEIMAPVSNEVMKSYLNDVIQEVKASRKMKSS